MTDFLPNTDNFFKYLLTIGILLIVFTIIYPIQKQREVDLEVLSYYGNVEILGNKISALKNEAKTLSLLQHDVQKELDSLKELQNGSNELVAERIQQIRVLKKSQFDLNKAALISKGDSLSVASINQNVEQKKIITLRSYLKIFRTYKYVFLLSGLFLVVIGLRYWLASVYMEELEKCKKLDGPGLVYKSSFVRHADFSKKYLKPWVIWTIIISLVILITLLCASVE